MTETNTTDPPRAAHPLAFEFMWDAAEHRRLLREIGRHRERSRGERVFWWALAVLVAGGTVGMLLAALTEGSVRPIGSAAPWLGFLLAWLVFRGPANAWFATRQFRRNSPPVDEPIRFRTDADGVHSAWGSQSSLVRWDGIRRVVETEAFFLFYTTPMCALFLPTRAIGGTAELEALRRLVRGEMGSRAWLLG